MHTWIRSTRGSGAHVDRALTRNGAHVNRRPRELRFRALANLNLRPHLICDRHSPLLPFAIIEGAKRELPDATIPG
jgi:hypothetical protein